MSKNLDEPIRSTNLVTQVVDRLRQRILSGELKPNAELLPESQMADAFGVSRTVIREAMRHLRAQDLVAVERGRRPWVRPVDPKGAIETINSFIQRSDSSLEHLIEVRRALESEVATLAAERATTAQVVAMKQANEEMLSAKTLDERISKDWLFHERFAEAGNNPIFVLLLETVAGIFRESLRKTSHSGAQIAYDGHARLIAAIEKRDPALARDIALDNLLSTEHDLEIG